jgi:hypothetical protein
VLVFKQQFNGSTAGKTGRASDENGGAGHRFSLFFEMNVEVKAFNITTVILLDDDHNDCQCVV